MALQLPAPLRRLFADRPKPVRDGSLQPFQDRRTKLLPLSAQYSPSTSVQASACCSAVINVDLAATLTSNGNPCLSSICARSMLKASPGLRPNRSKTFSAARKRFAGTLARKSVVSEPMLKSAQNEHKVKHHQVL